MGSSFIDASTSIPGKLYLDGTEIYKEDGQTVKNINELTEEELDRMFDDYFEEGSFGRIKKNPLQRAQK